MVLYLQFEMVSTREWGALDKISQKPELVWELKLTPPASDYQAAAGVRCLHSLAHSLARSLNADTDLKTHQQLLSHLQHCNNERVFFIFGPLVVAVEPLCQCNKRPRSMLLLWGCWRMHVVWSLTQVKGETMNTCNKKCIWNTNCWFSQVPPRIPSLCEHSY